MRISSSALVLAAVGVAAFGLLGAATVPAAAQGLALDPVEAVGALTRPVAIAAPGDGSGRLFIAQQTGEIVILDGGSLLATPFLDLSARVTCCGESGLLGLAFHPDYGTNGQFFVDFTETVGGQLRTVVARYTVAAGDPDVADPLSEDVLFTVDQPAGNHNGGQLAFGPDGFLLPVERLRRSDPRVWPLRGALLDHRRLPLPGRRRAPAARCLPLRRLLHR